MSNPEAVRRGKNNRKKGFNFEREIVKLFTAAGWEASRSWGSDGRSRGEKKELDVLVTKGDHRFKIQSKRKSKISADYRPIEGIDLQIFREDHQDPVVSLRLSTFLELFNEVKE